MIPSYSSPYAVGHRAIANLFQGPVLIQEKVDGSQISFGLNAEGDVEARSKGAPLNIVAPDKMFGRGVEVIIDLKDRLTPGFVYRGEYLMKPKHNVLAYDRTPTQHIILFDIEDHNKGEGWFLSPDEVRAEAERLGLETVPTLFHGEIKNPAALRELLATKSVLGGCLIEGVVVKNYAVFTPDKKVAMGKFVSEGFKEVHAGEWRKANPTPGDVESLLIAQFRTPARWGKAVQHLKEAGKVEGSPRDIGHLIKEVQEDIHRECEEEIKQALYDYYLPRLRRGVVAGFPEWYKDRLMEDALNAETEKEGG